MKKLLKILLGLVIFLIILFIFRSPLLNAIKPSLNAWLMTFPESEFLDSESVGSYASLACQNSHVDWGESVRVTQSLDGSWDVEQGDKNDNLPVAYGHQLPVPGFLTEATPAFTEVGQPSDQREAFWLRKEFTPSTDEMALSVLCLHKAKYGVKVWLNGQALGEHSGAYSVSEYDMTSAIRYGEPNELVVRLGADHTQLPEFVPIGMDLEKYRWYPGLWDSVSVVYTGPYSIVRTKVETDIDRNVVIAKTTIRNNSDNAATLTLTHQAKEWVSGQAVAQSDTHTLRVDANTTQEVTQEIPLSGANLWTPEAPFLYSLHTTLSDGAIASDDRATRFGMRKMEWKSGENKGFYLNNKLYYLRGTNIALHRFFEDQDRKTLPWDRQWVTRLLAGQKDFNWNSFRFHVGRAPNFWYDLADEIGLIVNDEYHIFSPIRLGQPGMPIANNWSLKELVKEYQAWIGENWNHPSIGWWSASNETHNLLPYKAVPLVRDMDPTRAWESGSYEAPDRPDDPLEEHPYKFSGVMFLNSNPVNYTLDDLDSFSRIPPETNGGIFSTYDGEGARSHAYINNEYGWLWLTRDGSDATDITGDTYERLTHGAEITQEERRELYAYVVSELSSYWRARRGYAGVQHFLYLGKCTDKDTVPEDWDLKKPSATCDNFIDIPRLNMEPRWARWGAMAFSPVMVSIEKWSESFYQTGGVVTVPVSLLNDNYETVPVELSLFAADLDGNVLVQSQPLTSDLPPLATELVDIDMALPEDQPYVLYARLSGGFDQSPVFSRRKTGLAHPGVIARLPTGLGIE